VMTLDLSTKTSSSSVRSLIILFIEGVIGYSSFAARMVIEVTIKGSYANLFSIVKALLSINCKNLSNILTPTNHVSIL
jgi:hypothetical protein